MHILNSKCSLRGVKFAIIFFLSALIIQRCMFWTLAEFQVLMIPAYSEWPVEIKNCAEEVKSTPGKRPRKALENLKSYLERNASCKTMRRWECWMHARKIMTPEALQTIIGKADIRRWIGGRDDIAYGYRFLLDGYEPSEDNPYAWGYVYFGFVEDHMLSWIAAG